jgi:hypothetical protein
MSKLIRETIIPIPKDSIVGLRPTLTWQQQRDGSWDGSLEKVAVVKVEPKEGGWWVSEMSTPGTGQRRRTTTCLTPQRRRCGRSTPAPHNVAWRRPA